MTPRDDLNAVSEERPENRYDVYLDVRDDLLDGPAHRAIGSWRSLAERYVDYDIGIHMHTRIKSLAKLGPLADYCAIYERAGVVRTPVALRAIRRRKEGTGALQDDVGQHEMPVFVDVAEVPEDAERTRARPVLSVVRLQPPHCCAHVGMYVRQPSLPAGARKLHVRLADQELYIDDLSLCESGRVLHRKLVRQRVECAPNVVHDISNHQAPGVGHWLRGADASDVLALFSVVLDLHRVSVRAQEIPEGLLYDSEVLACPV